MKKIISLKVLYLLAIAFLFEASLSESSPLDNQIIEYSNRINSNKGKSDQVIGWIGLGTSSFDSLKLPTVWCNCSISNCSRSDFACKISSRTR